MRLYFLRHGIAEEWSAGKPDEARRLTPEGIAEMQAVAAGLVRLQLKLDAILTSPLPRASETAAIVAEALELTALLRTEERLSPGFRLGDLQKIIGENSGAKRLMVVGHQPDMGAVSGQLIGSPPLAVKKGGLVRVEAVRIEPGGGLLEWFLTPNILIK